MSTRGNDGAKHKHVKEQRPDPPIEAGLDTDQVTLVGACGFEPFSGATEMQQVRSTARTSSVDGNLIVRHNCGNCKRGLPANDTASYSLKC